MFSGPLGVQCPQCAFSFAEVPENDEAAHAAELFPELEVEEKIAQGGFGGVFRAQHRRMKRTVALKFLDTVLARSPDAVALFEQEMISVGGLNHPGIVTAYDAGERDGQWYLIMEYVDGLDCGALVRKHGTLPIAESCEIIRQAALALHHAHGHGFVHRDVKPGNMMVSSGGGLVEERTEGKEGTQGTDDVPAVPLVSLVLSVPVVPSTVKVLDFGLAGLAVAPVFGAPAVTGGTTRFLGTLEYTAPEQIESPQEVDARADIYSLGATLWRFLTGKTPHPGSGEMSLFGHMKHITSNAVPSIATMRQDLPKPLVQLCNSMLALRPSDRPATAAEVARLIEPWCAGAELPRLFAERALEEKPVIYPKQKRPGLWAAAAAVVGIAGAAGMAFLAGSRRQPPTPAEPVVLEGRAVFSDKVARFHDIPPQNMPRLLSTEWEVERELLSTEQQRKVNTARLRPDGRLMWINTKETLTIEPGPDGKREEVKNPEGISKIGVQPETGNVVWTTNKHPDDLAIHRILPDGTKLTPLAPDFSKEGTAEARASMKAERLANGDDNGCAYPWGLAFVTENTVPPGSELRPGDVLYADEGHCTLYAPLRPLPFIQGTAPGLWKFRFDSDEPAQRLGSLPERWRKDDTYFPLDATVSRHGVFLLNRTNTLPSGKAIPADYNARVLRWDPSGFHPCTTDQPILSPAGIAADPLSPDLFVLDGGEIVQPGVMEQRILRLRPAGPDRYTVETFARKFRGFSYCGLQITPDGLRMVITDEKLSSVVVLQRKNPPRNWQPLFSEAFARERHVAEDAVPRFYSPDWAHDRESIDNAHKECGRLTPDGRLLSIDQVFDCPLRQLVNGEVSDAVKLVKKEEIRCVGVAPSGHIVWGQPQEHNGFHLGRALPDGTLLPTLRYDFAPEFPLGGFEIGREMLVKQGQKVSDGEPWDFAFVTAENLPPNTGLNPGDVLVADHGHRVFLQGLESVGGLWRFRLDNDAPARRVAKGGKDGWMVDVEVTRQGVFALDRLVFYDEQIPDNDPRHLNAHVLRWDQDGWHPCTTDKPILHPSGLAADPLSGDLYIIQGGNATSVGSDDQCISRLRPAGASNPDHYLVETFANRLGKSGANGIAFSADGQKMIITDKGNFAIAVLKRLNPPVASATPEFKPAPLRSPAARESSLEIPGWVEVGRLSHSSAFSSPHFAPDRKVIYCSKSRLRIVSDSGGEAENFLELKPQTPGFSGVAPDSGFVTWTQPDGGQHPTIGRAKADGSQLNLLEFATKEPPYPMGFAFVTEANLSPGLQLGDVLLACSRNELHPESKPGLWRFRCDNDEPVSLLATDETLLQYPMDVASSKAGVFLLNRSTIEPETNVTPADTNRRILRWDGTAFHPCTLSEPVQDPSALAADPLTTDLYVLQGAQGRDPKLQRLLRLKLTQTDTYTVEVLIGNLGGPAPCGICFSADGKRLLVGDTGGKRTLVLERQ